MRRLFLVLVACVGLTVIPARAATGTILILGDSLGAAYGMDLDQGWVALLQRRIADAGMPWRVVNASISGDTSAGARARLPAALERHQPGIVVLETGGNDGLRGLPLRQFRENLATMVKLCRASGARVVLVGVQLPPNYGTRYTSAFSAVYADVASADDLPLVRSIVDGIGTDPGLMQPDGIHPNVTAQPLMLDRVWTVLKPLL